MNLKLQDVDAAKLLLLDNLKRLERRCCPCYLPATIVRLCAWEWNERLLWKLTTVIPFFEIISGLSHTRASTIIL